MKQTIRFIMTLALLLTISIGTWADAAKVTIGTTTNVTISFANSESGDYSGVTTFTPSGTTVYMKVTPAVGYYIEKTAFTLTKTINSESAQAPARRSPGADFEVTLIGNDPTDLSTERIYSFTMPTNDADVTISNVEATARTEITDEMVTVGAATYTGAEQTASITVGTLTLGTDYTVSGTTTGTNATSYAFTVTGVGKYKGTVQKNFVIGKKAATVAAKAQSVPLNGAIATGVVQAELTNAVEGHTLGAVTLVGSTTENATTTGTITPSEAQILSGTDDVTANYDISYTAGVLTVEKANLTAGTVTASAVYGTQVKNIPVTGEVTFNNNTVNGVWSFPADDSTLPNVGTETAITATFTPATDAGNFNTLTKQVIPVISPKSFTDETITVTVTARAWTGTALTADEVVVKDGETQLTENTDYTITANAGGTDVGNYTVTVEGTGNYQNTKNGMFQITNPSASCGDGLTYVYDPSSKTITISKTEDGSGEMTNFTESNPAPWAALVDENTKVVIEDGVTSVGDNAFTSEPVPASIFIPESVTTTSESAISGNSDTFSYSKDNSGNVTITGYQGNSNIVEVPAAVGNSPVSGIGEGAFSGESKPANVFIPEGITVGDGAFDANSTNQFTYEETTDGDDTKINITGYHGSAEPVMIPSELGGNEVTIGSGAFTGNNDKPKNVFVPSDVVVAGDAFSNDDTNKFTFTEDSNGDITITGYEGNSDVVEIPTTIGGKDITKIDSGTDAPVFSGTQTVVVPESVADASTNAFGDNTSQLTYETADDGQGGTSTTITGFKGNAETVVVPSEIGGGNVTIGDGAFTGDNDSPKNVFIPSNVTANDNAFGGNTNQFTFTEDNEGDITITGYKGNSNVIEIPTEIGGKEVTKIDSGDAENPVFDGNQTIIVPDAINTQNTSAFGENTSQLTYETDNSGDVTITGFSGNADPVVIPSAIGGNTVTDIAEGTFTGDDAPKTVVVPNTVTGDTSSAIDPDKTDKFSYQEGTKTDPETGQTVPTTVITGYSGSSDPVVIPSELGGNDVTIGSGAFTSEGNDSPQNVFIPEGVETETGAFDNNATNQFTYTTETTTNPETGEETTSATITGYTGSSETVVIPTNIGGSTVTAIGDGAFSGGNDSPANILIPEEVNVETGAIDDTKTVKEEYSGVEADNKGNISVVKKTEGSDEIITVSIDEHKSSVTDAVMQTRTGVKLNYSRTLTADDEAYTICLPYAPPTQTGIKYYALSEAETDKFRFEEVETPEANKPYLAVVSSGEGVNVGTTTSGTLSGITIINEAGSKQISGYKMIGTLTGLSNADAATAGAYILQEGNTWKKVSSASEAKKAAYIPPFRAYIVATGGGSAAQLHTEFIDSSVTGINGLKTVDVDGTVRYYDLNGRRVSEPTQKGVYIIDGKKVMK